ncbi:MAG: HK97 gp10 family phage protein [Alphaproteobacteria bacterium]|nr:HK97 gp10 family phage protein [Alphaproteobacteria bacterium]
MAEINIDMSEYAAFFERMKQAGNGEFERSIKLFLEGLGYEFLRIVEDEIIRMQVVDTWLLLASFDKGASGNVWTAEDGGLSLEVGTNVEYASYVNDGHWANKKGVSVRFVPGIWSGDRFIYQRGASTGMMLKQQWVEGYHYWESALNIMERMIPKLLDAKLQSWLDEYFDKF